MNNVKVREIVKAKLGKNFRTIEGVFATVEVILSHSEISMEAKYNTIEMFKSKFNYKGYLDAIAINRALGIRNKSCDSDYINMLAMHMLSDLIFDCFVEYRNIEKSFK